MEKVSLFAHNWLIAYLNNRAFKQNRDVIKGKVLDMGCGKCPYKEEILLTASEYVGVDWGKSYHGDEQVNIFADLNEELPFEDDTADTIVTFQALEHLKEPAYFISECYRVLKKDGSIFVTVPFMWHLHERPYDYYRFTEYGLKYIFEKAGFKDIRIGKYCGFWPVWVLKFNYYTVRLARIGLKPMWQMIWLVGQAMAFVLDKLDRYPPETTHYWVRASK